MACYDFQDGKCYRGASCRFSHDEGGGRGRSNRDSYRNESRRDDRYRDDNGSRDERRSYRERSYSRGRKPASGGGGGGIQEGRIRRLSDKGFGFIDYGRDKSIFFHSTGMTTRGAFDDLREGDKVEFEAGVDDRSGRDRAENVVLLS